MSPQDLNRKSAKRLAYRVGLLAGCLILVDLAFGFLLSNTSDGRWQAPQFDTASEVQSLRHQILHPYFGFVKDPETSGAITSISEQGFFQFHEPPTSSDAFVVGVFGGSVANLLVRDAGALLRERLEATGLVRGLPVWVRSFAMGSYKQPQQLHVLSQMLAEGERFDVVLNLDGFNEVAAIEEHSQSGLDPLYPRDWHLRLEGIQDPELLRFVGLIEVERFELENLANSCLGWNRWSGLCKILRQRRQHTTLQTLHSLRERLAADATEQLSQRLVVRGPRPADSISISTQRVIDHWRRSSVLMHALASASDAAYLHVLQPNQYVPNAKRQLTPEEKRSAWRPDTSRAQAVARLLPELAAHGQQSLSGTVAFTDLTRLFEHEYRTVYSDSCCHLTELGNALLAERLVELMAQQLDRQ